MTEGSPLTKKSWGAHSLRSGFGDQPLSHRSSAPAAGFGSSSRDAFGKQYASAEVDRAQARARVSEGEGRGCAWNLISTGGQPLHLQARAWQARAAAGSSSLALPAPALPCRLAP